MKRRSPFRKLKQRLAVGSLGFLFTFLMILFSTTPFMRPIFTCLLAGVTAAALWEYYQIAKVKGYRPLSVIGVGGGAVYILSLYIAIQFPIAISLPFFLIALICFLTFLSYFYRGPDPQPLVNMAITLFGIIYIAIPLGCVLLINYFFSPESAQDGRWWLLYVLAVSKATDIGAYFSGKSLGSHPLAKHLSPRKTIEGAIGGLLAALLVSIIFPWILFWTIDNPNSFSLPWTHSIFLGLVVGILAQVGDLAESLLKRDAGVKDSNQLPGLGGILDIVDSLIFTLPLIYFYLHIQYQLTL